jgi:hypothetical protein
MTGRNHTTKRMAGILRHQYLPGVDVAPTMYDRLGVDLPELAIAPVCPHEAPFVYLAQEAAAVFARR